MGILPPGVSASDFGSAIKQLQAAVGPDWVLTSDEDLFPYRDPFSLLKNQPNELVPSAAVGPDSVEQVQAIVRIANQYRIPLYTISTGKNYAYGGASPNLPGSVVLDLKRMNRVLEVDEERHFALVEPGVSYIDLYRYIQDRGLKVWIDTPDPGWGSPIGNALDHGIGFTMGPYRDHFGASCGVEVVLPSGEVMRTGMGALPNSKSWNEYKTGFGPDPSGLFGQGNFGIVTKMGFRLMPQPEHWRNGLITVPKRQDLIPLVKTVNYLTDLFIIGNPWYNSPLRALLGNSDFVEAATRRDGVNDEEMDRLAASANLHSWGVELSFYGSERTTLANWEYAKELFARAIPTSRATDGESLQIPLTREQLARNTGPYHSNMIRKLTQGVPGLGVWYMVGRTEKDPDHWNETHIGLYSIVPRSGQGIFDAQRAFAKVEAELGIPTVPSNALATPSNWYQFTFIMGSSLRSGAIDYSPEGKRKQKEYLHRVLQENAKLGYGEYRAPPIFQDAVAEQYSFNNHVLRRFHETMKDAVDPNGILSPGRGGIWPKPFRSNRGKNLL
jgi:4-cresol dehydrogenase (hydroxylating)